MNLKKKYPIINFGRNYLGKTNFPANVICDMEIVSLEQFRQIVLDYVRQNRLIGRRVIVTLDPSLYFDKKYNSTPTPLEVAEFTSLLPFSTLSVKQIVRDGQTIVIAVNRPLLTELSSALNEAKVGLKYIIPEFALKETLHQPYAFDDLSVSRLHFPTVFRNQNTRLILFAVSLIIFCTAILWYQKHQSNQSISLTPSPTPTIQITPTPTIGIPSTRVDITYPTTRTLRYSDQLKKLLTVAGYKNISSQLVTTTAYTTKTFINFNPAYPPSLRDPVIKEARKLFRNLSIQDIKNLSVDVQIVIGRL